MSDKLYLTNDDIDLLAAQVARSITLRFNGSVVNACPIPRGGIPALYAVRSHTAVRMIDDPRKADLFIDDIIDSGRTRDEFVEKYKVPFFALIDKKTTHRDLAQRWIVFPWEGDAEGSFEDNVVRLLQFVGEDPTRTGLLETPKRVARAWQEWTQGYRIDPASVLKTFEDGADGVDEMVVVKDIPFYSHCEHHLAPIFGTATIAYIPAGKIVGLSKIPRLLYVFSRRLQVQERLTNQIADAIEQYLQPTGVGVVIKARHLCMESRGIDKQGHVTVTSALRGALRSKSEARAEFLDLAR